MPDVTLRFDSQRNNNKKVTHRLYERDYDFVDSVARRTGFSKIKVLSEIIQFAEEHMVFDDVNQKARRDNEEKKIEEKTEKTNSVATFNGGVVIQASVENQQICVCKKDGVDHAYVLPEKGDTLVILRD